MRDDKGLICGFILHAQRPAEPLSWNAITRTHDIADGAMWLHFNLIDTRAQNWIAKCDRIPQAARDVLLANDSRIRLEVTENSFIGVLGDLYHEFDADPESLGVLRIYADAGWVITGRRHPLKTLDHLRRELMSGVQIETPICLVFYLLQKLADTFGTVISNLSDVIDDIEDRIMRGRFQKGGQLGQVRRLLVRLRRHLNAERYALSHISGQLPIWCSEADILLFQRAFEKLSSVVQDLELSQERARLLQEEVASQLGEATNRNLYILSIVTAVFLPITLITSIFGMNVGGLPWTQDAFGFWWVTLSMLITLAIVLVVLQRRRFF